MTTRTIPVTCVTEHSLDYRQLRSFQGNLKTRTDKDIQHIRKSMLTHGFSFPMYVWRHVEDDNVVYDIIDGHGRLEAVHEFAKQGYTIPPVPVVFIEATDINDAMERLLQVNTLSSRYTETGIQELVLDLHDINLAHYAIPDIDTAALNESIGLLRNTLTLIDGLDAEKEEIPDTAEQSNTNEPQTLELVVQCTGCGKSFIHIVQT